MGRRELVVDGLRRQEGQIRMGPGVVTECVPGQPQFGGPLTIGSDEAAEHEEGRRHVFAGQYLQQSRIVAGVRTVVEGQVHDLGRRLLAGLLVGMCRSCDGERHCRREYRGNHCRTPPAHTSSVARTSPPTRCLGTPVDTS